MLLQGVHPRPTLTPQRPDDLIYIYQAVQATAQKGLAYTRQLPEQLIGTDWGWALNQAAAERKWLGPPDSTIQRCHFVDVVEADADFGVHLVLNRQVADIAAGSFVAICSYYEIPAAAGHIRINCLAEKINVWTHATEIRLACEEIPERAVNDARLPSYAEISGSEILLRLDRTTATTVWRYFCLPGDPLTPQCSLHQLATNFFAFYAAKNNVQEPARMILGPNWSISSAERELKRWLKSGKTRGKQASP